jgi:hypothetical protein
MKVRGDNTHTNADSQRDAKDEAKVSAWIQASKVTQHVGGNDAENHQKESADKDGVDSTLGRRLVLII